MIIKRFPWKKIHTAINGIMDAIPEVTSQIAPFGFAVSEYFYCNRKGPDRDYLICRRVRAMRYLDAKRNQKIVPPYVPLQSYQEFLSTYEFWPGLNVEMEMTSLLLKSFASIINDVDFHIKVDEQNYLKLPRGNNCKEGIVKFALKQTLKRKFADEEDYFYKAKLWGPYFNNSNVNTYPFYVLAFREMQRAGLDFVYRCEYLFFVKRLNKEIDEDNRSRTIDHSEYDPEKQVLASLNNAAEEEHENFDFEAAFNEVLRSEPPDDLRAYYEVYRCWPDGWPVRWEDYI
ncbi:hypothetical protein [Pedobacter ginsengisoli]|uniref:hypothetical protein n=1 Tax=Pedobacter ginsengisoli TaxID=363852 RepID=UPI00254ED598|nr:hypothetical protein [Pedobacter ginsengisoli]